MVDASSNSARIQLVFFSMLPWVDMLLASMLLNFFIGFFDSRSSPRPWVFIFTILSVLIARSSEPFSIYGIMVAQIGFLSTGTSLRKIILIGGLFGGKKIISYADIVKLPPLSGANAIPILNKKRPRNSLARTSVFKRLASSSRDSGSRGFRNSLSTNNKAFSMNVLPCRAFSLVSTYSGINGGIYSRGHRGRAGFWNSNLNLFRPRSLQWWPILKRGSVGPMAGPSALGHSGSLGQGPFDFICQFCKVRGHLELFCHLKKQRFGFPLKSFPSFESRSNLAGNFKILDYSSWFCSTSGSLTSGPPSFGCFEEFARVVLLKNLNRHLSRP